MTHAFGKLFAGISDAARHGFVRTPVELAIGVATACLFSTAIAAGTHATTQLAMTFGLAAFTTLIAVFATSALYELDVITSRQRWMLTSGYLLAGAVYGGFVLDVDLVAEIWRWGLLTAGLGLAAILTPLAARSPTLAPRDLTWRFTFRFGIRTILAGVYTTLLHLGFSLGLTAFREMFELGFSGEVFGHLAVWIFVAGGTWMIASGLPDFADRDSPIAERPLELVHRIGVWLVLPLLALYMVILYGYGARVLLTGEAPSNLLSPLSLGAAILGLVAMFFIEPLRRHRDQDWLAEIAEKFPLAYLPLLPMPAWAIWQRIAQHGWTEFRYVRLLAVGGLLLCFGWAAWRTVRRQSYSVTGMPAAFAVLFFLASFGPWGALSVSESSQLSRLQSQHETEGETSAASSEPKSPGWSRSNGSSHAGARLSYLVDHFGTDSLSPILPEDAGDVTSRHEACEVLEIDCSPDDMLLSATFESDPPVRIPTAGSLYRITYYGTTSSEAGGHLNVSTSDGIIELDLADGPTHTVELVERFANRIESGKAYFEEKLDDDQSIIELPTDGESTAYLQIQRLKLERSHGEDDWKIGTFDGRLIRPDR